MSYQQFGSILNPATGQNCQRRKLLNTDSPFLTYKKLSQPNPNLTQKPYKTQRKRNDLVESTPMVISMDSTEANRHNQLTCNSKRAAHRHIHQVQPHFKLNP